MVVDVRRAAEEADLSFSAFVRCAPEAELRRAHHKPGPEIS